jgi:hypothetical protein
MSLTKKVIEGVHIPSMELGSKLFGTIMNEFLKEIGDCVFIDNSSQSRSLKKLKLDEVAEKLAKSEKEAI